MSTTIQQAIEKIRNRYKTAIEKYHEAIVKKLYQAANDWGAEYELYELILAALREKQERENPEPLTLEELRHMDGEPVWIVAKHYRTFADVVQVMGRDKGDDFVGFKICHNLQENGHGKTWNAYRHKPKEKGGT